MEVGVRKDVHCALKAVSARTQAYQWCHCASATLPVNVLVRQDARFQLRIAGRFGCCRNHSTWAACSPVSTETDWHVVDQVHLQSHLHPGVIYFSSTSALKLRYNYVKRIWDMFETFVLTNVKVRSSPHT